MREDVVKYRSKKHNLELKDSKSFKIPRSETDLYNFSFGEMIYQGEKFPIKLRVKGDRMIFHIL